MHAKPSLQILVAEMAVFRRVVVRFRCILSRIWTFFGGGGVIITNDVEFNYKLRLLQNHGLHNRDEVVTLG